MDARPGIDIEDHQQLVDYLRAQRHIAGDEVPEIRSLEKQHAHRAVLVRHGRDGAWVIKQALRRSDPARLHREAAGLRALQALAPPGSVPGFVFEDHHHHLLGMHAIAQPHDNWDQLLMAGHLEHGHVQQFGMLLGTIHYNAWQQQENLRPHFNDRAVFRSMRLEPDYEHSARQAPEAAGFFEELIGQARSAEQTLVHGDYGPANILIHKNQLVLLDHEVIHWGDPAFDAGFAVAHLLSKAHHLTDRRDSFATAAIGFWRSYHRALEDAPFKKRLETRCVRQALGCLLALVVGQRPLDYLDAEQRRRQRVAVLRIMDWPPNHVEGLATELLERLD